jgi:hypothetical protein
MKAGRGSCPARRKPTQQRTQRAGNAGVNGIDNPLMLSSGALLSPKPPLISSAVSLGLIAVVFATPRVVRLSLLACISDSGKLALPRIRWLVANDWSTVAEPGQSRLYIYYLPEQVMPPPDILGFCHETQV